MTRWLDEDELQAWLKLAGVMLKLAPTLDSQLQRDSDLTHFDYLCLAMLSESDERTLRMSELATQPRFSSLLITCERRERLAFTRVASSLIRRVRSSLSESIARHR